MIWRSLTISCIIISFLLIPLFGALIIHLAAKLLSVKNATFEKALKACIVPAIASLIIIKIFIFVPGIGPAIGLFLSLIVTFYILKNIYNAGWIQSFIIWIIELIVIIVLTIIIAAVMVIIMFSYG